MKNKNFTGITDVPVGFEVKPFEELLFKDGELCNGTLSYDSPLVLCKPFHGHVHGDFTNGIPEKGCLWEKYSNGNLIAAGTVDYDGKFIFKKDARNQIFIKMKNKNFTGITDVPVGFEVKPFEELLFKDGELCNGTLSYDSPLVLCKPFHGHVHGDFTNGIPEKGCLWEKYSNGNLIAAGTVDYDGKFIFKKDARNQIFIKMKNKNFTGITDVPVGFEVKPFEELLFKDGELCNGTLSYDSPLVLCKPFHGHVHGDFTNGIPEKGCLWEKYSNGNLIADDY
jgi:hypothetical protein